MILDALKVILLGCIVYFMALIHRDLNLASDISSRVRTMEDEISVFRCDLNTVGSIARYQMGVANEIVNNSKTEKKNVHR